MRMSLIIATLADDTGILEFRFLATAEWLVSTGSTPPFTVSIKRVMFSAGVRGDVLQASAPETLRARSFPDMKPTRQSPSIWD